MAITRFIPDVLWRAGTRVILPEWFYDTVLEYFEWLSGRPVVVPKPRNKACLSAKALLHLAIQCKRIGDIPKRRCLRPSPASSNLVCSRLHLAGWAHHKSLCKGQRGFNPKHAGHSLVIFFSSPATARHRCPKRKPNQVGGRPAKGKN